MLKLKYRIYARRYAKLRSAGYQVRRLGDGHGNHYRDWIAPGLKDGDKGGVFPTWKEAWEHLVSTKRRPAQSTPPSPEGSR